MAFCCAVHGWLACTCTAMQLGPLSHAAQMQLGRIEAALRRRWVPGGAAALGWLAGTRPLRAQLTGAKRTQTAPDGVSRTTLEVYEHDGEEFRLMLVSLPPASPWRRTITPSSS